VVIDAKAKIPINLSGFNFILCGFKEDKDTDYHPDFLTNSGAYTVIWRDLSGFKT
jgi:hypothetical protein